MMIRIQELDLSDEEWCWVLFSENTCTYAGKTNKNLNHDFPLRVGYEWTIEDMERYLRLPLILEFLE